MTDTAKANIKCWAIILPILALLFAMTQGCTAPTYRLTETRTIEEWGKPAPKVLQIVPMVPPKEEQQQEWKEASK